MDRKGWSRETRAGNKDTWKAANREETRTGLFPSASIPRLARSQHYSHGSSRFIPLLPSALPCTHAPGWGLFPSPVAEVAEPCLC